MDPVWIAVAFILGFAMRQVGLPPLVGFLAAGFVLHAFGVRGGEAIQEVSDIGVILLLFSIGLKLRIKSLLRPEVWAGTSLHMLITVVCFGLGIYGLSLGGFGVFSGLDLGTSLMLAFALSFSSTVFAVKVLEEKGEMASLHARVAIGILIMQDLIAVLFLTFSTGKLPSPWAFLLVGLLLVRPLIMAVIDRSGHGELLILLGLLLTMGGAYAFEIVGLKPDLGALVLGVLVGGHPKAGELAKSLLSFKDLFLVGFFLNIGLSGAPSLEALGVAILLAVVVPFKVSLFFLLLTRFTLRARSSLLASLSLANYSEFGLIVGAVGVSSGWIGGEWLVIIAIALSITFVLASPLNTAAHSIYARFAERLKPFESKTYHPEELPVEVGEAQIAIFGMGRVGTGAYDAMRERYGDVVLGLDYDAVTVRAQQAAGRNVIQGDATDPGFWERAKGRGKAVRLIMLAMPQHSANMYAAKVLAAENYPGLVAATAQFPDEIEALKKEGVHAAFNFFEGAGAGFAGHVAERLEGSDRNVN
ncbi:MAG: cation:proton antiporter family protein [candidate division NC10 bacterium]